MRPYLPFILATFLVCTAQVPAPQPRRVDSGCAPLGTPYLRTTLYMGLSRKGGVISKEQWRTFLQKDVSSRFPEGLTVWEADGQWRNSDGHIGRERAKVLLLVHKDTPEIRASLAALVAAYKTSFNQESVLWETAPVCAAF